MKNRKFVKIVWTAISVIAAVSMVVYLILPVFL